MKDPEVLGGKSFAFQQCNRKRIAERQRRLAMHHAQMSPTKPRKSSAFLANLAAAARLETSVRRGSTGGEKDQGSLTKVESFEPEDAACAPAA